ncbi:MAG: hypothetical protein WCI74_14440 [Actinomycetes bacterium]
MTTRMATGTLMCALTAGAVLAAPASAATADVTAPASNPIQISGPASGPLNTRIPIKCTAPTTLAGSKVLLYQNGKLIRLTNVKVGATGACNFKFSSGISGDNTLKVVVKKTGVRYVSNSIIVRILTAAESQLAAAKKPIKLTGPKTGQLWKRINITCQAPASLAGAKVTMLQNGTVLPQKKGLKVSASGSCNFWLKSGIAGVNAFTVTALKNGVTYKANTIKITLS